jgi:beta-N-acetylhexosaminidase
MELHQKIGQLFMFGFQGTELTSNSPIINDLSKYNLGGVILFDKLLAKRETENNIKSPAQVKALTTSLQQYASSPLLITVDQEGGLVRRLKSETGFPETKSAQALGKADDTTLTTIHAACTAVTLKSLGINLNLAPCVDLNCNPDNPVIGKLARSFSADVETVCRHASIWIKEHRKQQILTCLKHFPGHGSSQTDSHLGFTDISKSWHREELSPFKQLIQQDLADCVMPGHLFHSDFDSNYPTSLSPSIIHSVLREELGFGGLVITDDLQMKAITDRYGLAESACLALAAGADMIIIGNNLEYDPHLLEKIIPVVIDAVKKGKISTDRINQALRRVENVKKNIH